MRKPAGSAYSSQGRQSKVAQDLRSKFLQRQPTSTMLYQGQNARFTDKFREVAIGNKSMSGSPESAKMKSRSDNVVQAA